MPVQVGQASMRKKSEGTQNIFNAIRPVSSIGYTVFLKRHAAVRVSPYIPLLFVRIFISDSDALPSLDTRSTKPRPKR